MMLEQSLRWPAAQDYGTNPRLCDLGMGAQAKRSFANRV